MDNTIRALDTAYGSMTTITVASGLYVLTTAQASAPVLNVLSASNAPITGNVIIGYPNTIAGRRIIIPNCNMGSYGLWVRGNGGTEAIGVYFWIQFGVPYGIVVTPSRVYWDYGAHDPGMIVDKVSGWAGNGWLPCDGRYVGMQQHDLLYDIIGGTYGLSGSFPTGSFKLPDFRGTVLAMADQIGTVPAAGPFAANAGNRGVLYSWGINAYGGEATHTLAAAEMPSHTHPVGDPGHTHGLSDPGHAHSYTEWQASGPFPGGSGGPYTMGGTGANTSVSGTGIGIAVAGTGVYIGAAGSSGAHNNTQPTTTTMKVIKW